MAPWLAEKVVLMRRRILEGITQPWRILPYVGWCIGGRMARFQESRMRARADRALSALDPAAEEEKRRNLLAKLAGSSPREVDRLVAEVVQDLEFQQHLASKQHSLEARGFDGMTGSTDCITLYVLVRTLRPKVMVETGVEFGASSAHILRAMALNGTGELHSIDLPLHRVEPFDTELGSGCLVPDYLRDRWNTMWGDSRDLLPELLDKLECIDLFFHDSVHTYGFMAWEYETSWPFIRRGGVLASHDVWRHSVWVDFCGRYATEVDSAERIYNIGIIRKRQQASLGREFGPISSR